MDVELGEEVYIVIGGSEKEGVVDVAVVCRPLEFIIECFKRRGLWHGVGHVEESRHTAVCRGAAL